MKTAEIDSVAIAAEVKTIRDEVAELNRKFNTEARRFSDMQSAYNDACKAIALGKKADPAKLQVEMTPLAIKVEGLRQLLLEKELALSEAKRRLDQTAEAQRALEEERAWEKANADFKVAVEKEEAAESALRQAQVERIDAHDRRAELMNRRARLERERAEQMTITTDAGFFVAVDLVGKEFLSFACKECSYSFMAMPGANGPREIRHCSNHIARFSGDLSRIPRRNWNGNPLNLLTLI